MYLCSMKTLIKTAIVASVLLTSCVNKNTEKSQIELANQETCVHVCNHYEHPINNNGQKYYDPNKTIIIRGLGYVSQSDLEYASKVINEFYGYKCVISENLEISNELYLNGNQSVIESHEVMVKYNNLNTRTIFLTNKNLYRGTLELRGYTTTYGKAVVVKSDKSYMKETLIHELGHTLGLHHCNNLTCIMAIYNDQYDSGDFCNKCKNFLNK